MIRAFYLRWVLGRPWLFVAFFLALGAGFGSFLPEFELHAGSSTLVLEGDDSKRVYDATRELFETDDYILVAIRPPDPWSAEGVALLAELTADLEAVEGIESVLSPTTLPLFASHVDGKRKGLGRIQSLTDPDVDFDAARAELSTSPLFSNFLVSGDGSRFLVVAQLENVASEALRTRLLAKEAELAGADHPSAAALAELARLRAEKDAAWAHEKVFQRRVVEDVRTILPRYRERGAVVHASGLPTVSVDMVNYIEHDIRVFGLAVTVFLLLALGLFFRRPRFVLLPLLTCLLTVVTIMGMTVAADIETTVVTSNISSLLFIIGMAHSIHLVVEYKAQRAAHPDRPNRETLWESVRAIFQPCLYTALTTCVGFYFLVLTDIGPVKDFAVTMAVGVLLAFVVSLTFLPAALALLPPTEEKPEAAQAPVWSGVLAALGGFATRRRGVIYALTLVLAAVAAYGISQIRVETQFIDYFVESTEVHQGIRFVDQVGGTMTLEVILPGEGEDYWLEPENFERLEAVHAFFAKREEVGKTLSLVNFRQTAAAINPMFGKLPVKVLAKLLMASADVGPEVKGFLGLVVTEDFETARVQVRVRETSPKLHRQELIAETRTFLAQDERLRDQETIVTGMFQLFTNMLSTLIGSQVKSFGWVFVAVAVMLVLLMRSVRVGLLMMIPNVLPIAMVLGTMGLGRITLDLMTVMIASIAMGIAADATIHYVVRYRRVYGESGDGPAAVLRAHRSIGRAILYTALTVIFGFFVLLLSRFTPTIYFGVLTGVAMVAGIAADLLLLPALLLTFQPFPAVQLDEREE